MFENNDRLGHRKCMWRHHHIISRKR